jgi:hypothetical protein
LSDTTSPCGERGRCILRLIGAVLVGGLFASSPAGAGEPILSVRVLDQETGREISDPQCALIDPAHRIARAIFTGGAYRGDVTPRAGDELLIYRRGYDLVRLAIDPSERALTARLRRARTCKVRVGPGDHAGLPVAVVVKLKAWQTSPILDSYRVALQADSRLQVPASAGLQPFVVVGPGEDHCLWPRAFWIQAGGAYDVTVELPRLLEVRRDGNQPPYVRGRVRIFADLAWTPPLEPARIDAWRNTVYDGYWLDRAFQDAGEFLPVLPDAPFHFFAELDGRPVYRYVSRRDEVLDLRRPFTTKLLSRRPLVDGRPVTAGTLIAPGRLDMFTILELRDARLRAYCCYHISRADESEWPEVRLPPSEWLTIWHADHGLAHVAWRKCGAPKGSTYPGRLTVTAPEGFRATGFVSVLPTWKGTGEWRLTRVEEYSRRWFNGRRGIVFPGLRPAHYALDIQVTLTEVATGRAVQLQQMREISVTAKDLSPTCRLSEGRK